MGRFIDLQRLNLGAELPGSQNSVEIRGDVSEPNYLEQSRIGGQLIGKEAIHQNVAVIKICLQDLTQQGRYIHGVVCLLEDRVPALVIRVVCSLR